MNLLEYAELKFEILTQGVRLSTEAISLLSGSGGKRGAKPALRTRSGVSGGLDLQLDENLFVNAPIREFFARKSRLELAWQDKAWVILRDSNVVAEVGVLPEPEYYAKATKDGSRLLSQVAQMCSPDRICYGMTGSACFFWEANRRCKYCSIGLNGAEDPVRKKSEYFLEALEYAVREKQFPAKHILIGGGTPSGPDMGATLASALCRAVKERFPLSVYVMIAAPLENRYIDELHDAGVDELGMNLELWSDEAWREIIPGKHKHIGKARYLKALEYSVQKFGSIRTRSILIAGLESDANTLSGVRALAERGVMPIISPFRPLDGTELEAHPVFSLSQYQDLFGAASSIANSMHLPLGPTCVCCQNNTIALPYGHWYKSY
jgi:hypothetical protein